MHARLPAHRAFDRRIVRRSEQAAEGASDEHHICSAELRRRILQAVRVYAL
jgi:hypothetical protein